LKFVLFLNITFLWLSHFRHFTRYVPESTSRDSIHRRCFICVRIYDSVLPRHDAAPTGNRTHTYGCNSISTSLRVDISKTILWSFLLLKVKTLRTSKGADPLTYRRSVAFKTKNSLLKWNKPLRIYRFTFNVPLYGYSTISQLRLNHIEIYNTKWYTIKLKRH